MAVRSSVGRRGKSVNVGRSDMSEVGLVEGVWELEAVDAGKPTLDANLPSAPGAFILGDDPNEASLIET